MPICWLETIDKALCWDNFQLNYIRLTVPFPMGTTERPSARLVMFEEDFPRLRSDHVNSCAGSCFVLTHNVLLTFIFTLYFWLKFMILVSYYACVKLLSVFVVLCLSDPKSNIDFTFSDPQFVCQSAHPTTPSSITFQYTLLYTSHHPLQPTTFSLSTSDHTLLKHHTFFFTHTLLTLFLG